jgi:hypothetical protein
MLAGSCYIIYASRVCFTPARSAGHGKEEKEARSPWCGVGSFPGGHTRKGPLALAAALSASPAFKYRAGIQVAGWGRRSKTTAWLRLNQGPPLNHTMEAACSVQPQIREHYRLALEHGFFLPEVATPWSLRSCLAR